MAIEMIDKRSIEPLLFSLCDQKVLLVTICAALYSRVDADPVDNDQQGDFFLFYTIQQWDETNKTFPG